MFVWLDTVSNMISHSVLLNERLVPKWGIGLLYEHLPAKYTSSNLREIVCSLLVG